MTDEWSWDLSRLTQEVEMENVNSRQLRKGFSEI